MEVALTWNLVLLSTFILLFAYNFLLGQNATIKLILSIYIAILTADGLAGILKQFVFDVSPGFQILLGENENVIFSWIRILLFLIAIIIFVVKSGFHVLLDKHDHWAMRLGIHSVFSILSAILFISTILIYMSGNSFVEGMVHAQEITIYKESLLAKILIDYYQFWFSLPAIAFLTTSFLFEPENKT
ncbi:hypothetical protein KAI58_02515 [Candidatus Gracilibacteria bacterium]|nr:hypothetical protein [Candidatus Gracilibacteria bacterium]